MKPTAVEQSSVRKLCSDLEVPSFVQMKVRSEGCSYRNCAAHLLAIRFERDNLLVISCLVLFKQITVILGMCIDTGKLHSAGNILLIESKSP